MHIETYQMTDVGEMYVRHGIKFLIRDFQIVALQPVTCPPSTQVCKTTRLVARPTSVLLAIIIKVTVTKKKQTDEGCKSK